MVLFKSRSVITSNVMAYVGEVCGLAVNRCWYFGSPHYNWNQLIPCWRSQQGQWLR